MAPFKSPTVRFKKARPSKRQLSRQAIDGIQMRRDRLVSQVESLRGRRTGSKFAETARQLLGRWWATASWPAREELLRNAEWLLRLEQISSDRTAIAVVASKQG
jgi:hypothetical protein